MKQTCTHSPYILAPSPHPFHHQQMDDKPGDELSPFRGERGGKRVAPPITAMLMSSASAPCGACKFLRRKCVSGCVFAAHFGSDQGAARFAAVHKVFGASNVSKLLLHIPANQRHDAVVTISYEAQARLSDPIYGCVSTILALQQQVAALEAELSIVQTQLINSRLAIAKALQNSQSQQQHLSVLQPAYSNNSSASTNLVNLRSLPSNFELTADTQLSSQSFRPTGLSAPSQDEDDDEEDSRNPIIFSNQIFHNK